MIKLHSFLKAKHKGLMILKQCATLAKGKHFSPLGLHNSASVESEHFAVTFTQNFVDFNYAN